MLFVLVSTIVSEDPSLPRGRQKQKRIWRRLLLLPLPLGRRPPSDYSDDQTSGPEGKRRSCRNCHSLQDSFLPVSVQPPPASPRHTSSALYATRPLYITLYLRGGPRGVPSPKSPQHGGQVPTFDVSLDKPFKYGLLLGSVCRTETMHQLLCFNSKFPNRFAFTLGHYLFLLFWVQFI